MININDYDFEFPESLIAERPLPKGQSTLLYCPKDQNLFEKIPASSIVDHFKAGDCLVVNNTKVIPARLLGQKATGGKFEILLIAPATKRSGVCWEAWVKPGKYFKKGSILNVDDIEVEVLDVLEDGARILNFNCTYAKFEALLDSQGKVPLPPYIRREADDQDKTDYQTIFAKIQGAVAAPTASLHFSEEMLLALKNKGVHIAEITLHVGPGTFKPVEVENALEHPMHGEQYVVSPTAAQIINNAKAQGGRIITLGTTSTRVIETVANDQGLVIAGDGVTHKYIYPGYTWKCVNGIVTNFHFPKTTLILLVAALLGKERTLSAYQYAIQNQMRLFSYGDGMFIL